MNDLTDRLQLEYWEYVFLSPVKDKPHPKLKCHTKIAPRTRITKFTRKYEREIVFSLSNILRWVNEDAFETTHSGITFDPHDYHPGDPLIPVQYLYLRIDALLLDAIFLSLTYYYDKEIAGQNPLSKKEKLNHYAEKLSLDNPSLIIKFPKSPPCAENIEDILISKKIQRVNAEIEYIMNVLNASVASIKTLIPKIKAKTVQMNDYIKCLRTLFLLYMANTHLQAIQSIYMPKNGWQEPGEDVPWLFSSMCFTGSFERKPDFDSLGAYGASTIIIERWRNKINNYIQEKNLHDDNLWRSLKDSFCSISLDESLPWFLIGIECLRITFQKIYDNKHDKVYLYLLAGKDKTVFLSADNSISGKDTSKKKRTDLLYELDHQLISENPLPDKKKSSDDSIENFYTYHPYVFEGDNSWPLSDNPFRYDLATIKIYKGHKETGSDHMNKKDYGCPLALFTLKTDEIQEILDAIFPSIDVWQKTSINEIKKGITNVSIKYPFLKIELDKISLDSDEYWEAYTNIAILPGIFYLLPCHWKSYTDNSNKKCEKLVLFEKAVESGELIKLNRLSDKGWRDFFTKYCRYSRGSGIDYCLNEKMAKECKKTFWSNVANINKTLEID